MRNIGSASAMPLAIALAFFGCRDGLMQPKDASVGVLGPGGGIADSGGAVGGAGGTDSAVSSPDSGSGNGAIVWTQSSGSSPVGDWQAVASSSDGTRLVAVDSRTIYTSGDSGATWSIPPSSPMDNWTSVASSADGTRLIAVGMEQGPALMSDGSWKYGYVYTSSDSGATWAQTGTQGSWTGVASSADGTKLVAVSSDGDIYASTDSGATWTDRTNSPRGPFLLWSSLASSADGTKLVAAGSSEGVTDWPLGYICTSWDSGATWTQRGTLQSWQSLASSADGAKLIAVAGDRVDPGYIYTSGDSGATWTQTGTAQFWVSVASSADGTKLVAATRTLVTGELNPGYIYVSADSGATWTQTGTAQNWTSVASSADGDKLVATDSFGSNGAGGYIYTFSRSTP